VTAASFAKPSRLIVGRIRRAHGVRGEVLVEVLTDSPERVFAPGARVLLGDPRGDAEPSPRALRVGSALPFKDGLRVGFDDISSRSAAELLGGRYLLLPSEEIAPPGRGQIFEHDLIGLTVRDRGVAVGTVASYYHGPAGLLLEVRRDKGIALLPYRPEFIVAVDLDRRLLEVEVPEGLF
jgi:16S rRNA processing protein RimM